VVEHSPTAILVLANHARSRERNLDLVERVHVLTLAVWAVEVKSFFRFG